MRTFVLRLSAFVFVAVLVLAVAVVALAGQPKVSPTHRGLPDVECPSGVTTAQMYCYTKVAPVDGAPAPSDFPLPPEGTSPAP